MYVIPRASYLQRITDFEKTNRPLKLIGFTSNNLVTGKAKLVEIGDFV